MLGAGLGMLGAGLRSQRRWRRWRKDSLLSLWKSLFWVGFFFFWGGMFSGITAIYIHKYLITTFNK